MGLGCRLAVSRKLCGQKPHSGCPEDWESVEAADETQGQGPALKAGWSGACRDRDASILVAVLDGVWREGEGGRGGWSGQVWRSAEPQGITGNTIN